MTNTDKERCFALLGKLTSCSLSEEERLIRLLQISSYKQKTGRTLSKSTDSKKKSRPAQNAGENVDSNSSRAISWTNKGI